MPTKITPRPQKPIEKPIKKPLPYPLHPNRPMQPTPGRNVPSK